MNQRLVFFDLETAGPDPKKHPIIQIAAIAVDDDLEVLEAFEAKVFFDPKRAKAHSLRKNHYHPGVWAKEAREPIEVARDFSEFLRRHATVELVSRKGESYKVAQLVAHNAAYDGQFLFEWFERLGVYLPGSRQTLCTLQLALWHFAISEEAPPANYKLSTLCAHFGVPFHAASAHEALGDAAATVGLHRAIVQSVGSVFSMEVAA